MASNKPTIRSIAAAAGVSRGTVDRVINNRAHVSPESGHVYSALHVNSVITCPLRSTGASLRIGVIVPQWEVPYFTEQTRHGIGQATRLLGSREVRLIVEELHSRSTDEYVKCCEALCRQGIHGLVLNAGQFDYANTNCTDCRKRDSGYDLQQRSSPISPPVLCRAESNPVRAHCRRVDAPRHQRTGKPSHHHW